VADVHRREGAVSWLDRAGEDERARRSLEVDLLALAMMLFGAWYFVGKFSAAAAVARWESLDLEGRRRWARVAVHADRSLRVRGEVGYPAGHWLAEIFPAPPAVA
jgi:hypothetical protein